MPLSLKGRKAKSFLLYHRTNAAYWTIPDMDGEYYRMRDSSGVPRNFFQGGGVQQIQLKTEDREDGDLGVVAP